MRSRASPRAGYHMPLGTFSPAGRVELCDGEEEQAPGRRQEQPWSHRGRPGKRGWIAFIRLVASFRRRCRSSRQAAGQQCQGRRELTTMCAVFEASRARIWTLASVRYAKARSFCTGGCLDLALCGLPAAGNMFSVRVLLMIWRGFTRTLQDVSGVPSAMIKLGIAPKERTCSETTPIWASLGLNTILRQIWDVARHP